MERDDQSIEAGLREMASKQRELLGSSSEIRKEREDALMKALFLAKDTPEIESQLHSLADQQKAKMGALGQVSSEREAYLLEKILPQKSLINTAKPISVWANILNYFHGYFVSIMPLRAWSMALIVIGFLGLAMYFWLPRKHETTLTQTTAVYKAQKSTDDSKRGFDYPKNTLSTGNTNTRIAAVSKEVTVTNVTQRLTNVAETKPETSTNPIRDPASVESRIDVKKPLLVTNENEQTNSKTGFDNSPKMPSSNITNEIASSNKIITNENKLVAEVIKPESSVLETAFVTNTTTLQKANTQEIVKETIRPTQVIAKTEPSEKTASAHWQNPYSPFGRMVINEDGSSQFNLIDFLGPIFPDSDIINQKISPMFSPYSCERNENQEISRLTILGPLFSSVRSESGSTNSILLKAFQIKIAKDERTRFIVFGLPISSGKFMPPKPQEKGAVFLAASR